ncbi:hypothetical protein G7068_07140 [Leucobacter viscericola]|uniref:Uncharacterized protein n=1 Tax=Leucobacter viscericola TaxID=2714935 RepID=A0A6G7XEQ4_9MICO|nr:hypothetical protein [Leucobacter viscericola]QIK62992.1 hypothetical protein G7068_07140 [Leucobacter viscericola]
MRTIVKSIAGGALALLLALSVAPANALDPLAPEDDVTIVDDQNPAAGDNDDLENTSDSDGTDGDAFGLRIRQRMK